MWMYCVILFDCLHSKDTKSHEGLDSFNVQNSPTTVICEDNQISGEG